MLLNNKDYEVSINIGNGEAETICYWFLHIVNFEITSIIIHGYEF
jgi:hypothetical protein